MKLTREQRFLLMRGTCPRLAFPADKPLDVEKGSVVKLSKQVEIVITGITRTKKGEKTLEYVLRDLRPNLLRRTPQVHQPETDSEGYVRPPQDADIEAARLDSSYTHSPHGAISDAGEAVPEVDQAKLTIAARSRWAQKTDRAEERAREDAKRLAAQIRDILVTQARSGVDSTPFLADLQRLAREQMDEEAEAA
jgi:hypothetical protein